MELEDLGLIAQTINDFAYYRINGFEGTASIARVLGERFADALREKHPDFPYNVFMARCTRKPEPRWFKVDVDRFDEMLGVVPPVAQGGKGFLVGEPCDCHGEDGTTRWTAMLSYNGSYYESLGPMTMKDWRAFEPARDGIKIVPAPRKKEG